ncbi:MAG: NAD-dependent epimerase/dehydratase family protein [Thermoflexales bacterium]|nr:NAD-dependent epimerase/dehydratase family protein [Thermoflexales bacterium]MDW8351734.1 NAD-dependent epimerase/dehydratase family protein [Anaerolineae bacterium]
MAELHTVFGASGALGSAIVHHLAAEGLPIRAVARDPAKAAEVLPDGVDIVTCDATDAASVIEACKGARVIYNCIYIGDRMKEVAAHLLEGARAVGARLVSPSNGLVYGPLQYVPVREDHPHAANSRRGLLRKEIEAMLMEAHAKGDVPVVIPRLATFYGAHVHGTFMSMIFEAAHHGRRAMWFGRLDVPHDLLYLPDAAAACVLLALNDDAYGQAWHVPGAGPLTGEEFIRRVFAAWGKPPKIGTRGRTFFRLISLLVPRISDTLEVLYQFEQPFVMDGSKFAAAYPDFEYTPHDVGIQDTVNWYRAQFNPGE